MTENTLYDRLKIEVDRAKKKSYELELTEYQKNKINELSENLNLYPEDLLNFIINFAYLSNTLL